MQRTLAKLILLFTFASHLVISAPVDTEESKEKAWVAVWTTAPQAVEGDLLPPNPFGDPSAAYQLRNTTIRQTFSPLSDANRIRLQFSNRFANHSLAIAAASIALTKDGGAGVGGIDINSSMNLTFGGLASALIAPGEVIYSDPLDFAIKSSVNVALSTYTEQGLAGQAVTGHPGSRTTTWLARGNQVNSLLVSEASIVCWYLATSIEGLKSEGNRSLVVLGDSITDGRGSTTNGNDRWTDVLAESLRNHGIGNVAVNNQGIGGNNVLSGGLGPTLMQRFERDALSQAGIRYVMIFEGVNDIGTTATDEASQHDVFQRLKVAYADLIRRANVAGITTIGGTITPFGDNPGYAHPEREKTRLKLNDWILYSGTYDYIVDFASIIGDGGDKLKTEYSSDGLHPNAAGYQLMGTKFPLEILQPDNI